MIAITKNPTIYINNNASKWFPAHQPITFEVTRKDVNVIQKYVIYGQIQFNLTSRLPSTILVGQSITYVQSNKSITLIVTGFGNNFIRVAYNYSLIGGVLGFINLNDALKGHYVETLISYVDNSNVYQTLGSIKNKVNSLGIAKVSVQELLSTKTINQNDFLYNKINSKQFGEGSKFNIQIRECFNGISGKYTILTDSNVLYYTNSANQTQDKYGYNMGSHVPTYDNGRTDKAKFQSVFKRPTYFVGYPFSLNFIYSENMLNYQLIRKETTKDINGTTIATTSDNLFVAERFFANRIMLKQGYTSNIKTIDFWIETGAATGQRPWTGVDTYAEEGYGKGFGVREVIRTNIGLRP
jgi:hypothetical protein